MQLGVARRSQPASSQEREFFIGVFERGAGRGAYAGPLARVSHPASGVQLGQALLALGGEALDALPERLGIDVRLLLEFLDAAARAPAVVPVGAHRVALGHLVR